MLLVRACDDFMAEIRLDHAGHASKSLILRYRTYVRV
jgi:hypothetical protein